MFQKGFSQILLLILLLGGIGLGTYLVQQKTDILPKAAESDGTGKIFRCYNAFNNQIACSAIGAGIGTCTGDFSHCDKTTGETGVTDRSQCDFTQDEIYCKTTNCSCSAGKPTYSGNCNPNVCRAEDSRTFCEGGNVLVKKYGGNCAIQGEQTGDPTNGCVWNYERIPCVSKCIDAKSPNPAYCEGSLIPSVAPTDPKVIDKCKLRKTCVYKASDDYCYIGTKVNGSCDQDEECTSINGIGQQTECGKNFETYSCNTVQTCLLPKGDGCVVGWLGAGDCYAANGDCSEYQFKVPGKSEPYFLGQQVPGVKCDTASTKTYSVASCVQELNAGKFDWQACNKDAKEAEYCQNGKVITRGSGSGVCFPSHPYADSEGCIYKYDTTSRSCAAAQKPAPTGITTAPIPTGGTVTTPGTGDPASASSNPAYCKSRRACIYSEVDNREGADKGKTKCYMALCEEGKDADCDFNKFCKYTPECSETTRIVNGKTQKVTVEVACPDLSKGEKGVELLITNSSPITPGTVGTSTGGVPIPGVAIGVFTPEQLQRIRDTSSLALKQLKEYEAQLTALQGKATDPKTKDTIAKALEKLKQGSAKAEKCSTIK